MWCTYVISLYEKIRKHRLLFSWAKRVSLKEKWDVSQTRRFIRFTVNIWPGRLATSCDFFCHFQIYLSLNFTSPIFIRRILALIYEPDGLNLPPSCARYLGTSWNRGLCNLHVSQYELEWASSRTKCMFGIHWPLPNVLLCCTPTNLGVWAAPVPSQCEQNSIWVYS